MSRSKCPQGHGRSMRCVRQIPPSNRSVERRERGLHRVQYWQTVQQPAPQVTQFLIMLRLLLTLALG